MVRGQVHSTALARDYFASNHALRATAFESLEWLQSRHDVLVLEGAGSCAEVNLRSREFVNFAAAHASRARVLLVADIERGGVFAQIVGSLELLLPEDRARVCGVIVNKFRGDPTLFDDGVKFLEERTGLPVLGVIPYLRQVGIDGEDSLNVPLGFRSQSSQPPLAVICYPYLANFTDFDALGLEEVDVHFIRQFTSLRGYAAVLLPGSKAVASDLEWMRRTGLAEELSRFVADGGKVLGICGGLQMLGTKLCDPHGVESPLTEINGLGYLNLTTQLNTTKTVRSCQGLVAGDSEQAPVPVEGYEIHHGSSFHGYSPLFQLRDAAKSEFSFAEGVRTNQVWGTYLHGLFDAPGFRHAFLRWVFDASVPLNPRHQASALDSAIDEFAEHVRKHIHWPRILSWLTPV